MQTGGVAAAHAPAPPNGYGSPQQQQQQLQQQQQQLHQQQQQMLLQQHNQQQQLSSNSPASTAATGTATTNNILVNGGRFDFDDGGTYCGGWEDGKAHGHGVCTGPKGQGAYSGSWHYGFEVSGVYMWPSGNTFEGQWQNGKRHGLGVESRGRWLYRGEWTQGFKGRYGVRQSATTNAKYEGTWANGLQDGYGSETYADGGTFQGQWMRGMRHGYGVRTSARFGMASHSKPNKSDIRNSLSSLGSDDAHNKVGSASEDPVIGSEGRDKKLDDTRGGFVLKANSDEQPNKRKTLVSKSTHSLKRTFMSGFKMRKQRSTGELEKKVSGSIRSTASCTSWISTGSSQSAMGESYNTDSNASFIVEDEHMDINTTETYVGEWKNDKRSGYGIAERTDGLKYEGEWFANKKYGYGVTTFKDGTKEEGKYKNNVLITSQKKKHYFLMRSAKLKERIEASVNAAHRASKIALQKADIAISRMATARGKAELSDIAADHAREDYEIAKLTAKQFAPDFIQPGLEKTRLREILKQRMSIDQKSILQPLISTPNPAGPAQSSSDAADAASLSLSTNNLLYTATGGGQQQDAAETTPQFRPRSHYAQPYYQSTGGGGSGNHQQQQQQQQQQSGGVSPQQSNMGNVFSRNSTTPEMRQNQNSGGSSNRTYVRPANNGIAPESIPRRPYVTHNDVGVGTESTGNAGNSGSAGSAPTTARQSAPIDRASFSPQRVPSTSSHAVYSRAAKEGGGMGGMSGMGGMGASSSATARRDSGSGRPNRYNQYEVGPDYDADPSLLRRNAKYVDREALFSFQQAMSDHFDHYKRPPSRDNSVDRYSRAASRLSGGSRQSSVEKSQNQQQQRRGGDDRLPSSSSSAADKSFNGAAGFTAPSMSGAMQNVPSSSAMQRQPPFEEIILRQRNLGQEIVPSPIGQPKRTESLYVNTNTARKETKPKVSTTSTRVTSRRDSIKNDDDYNSYYGSVGSGGSNYNYGNRRDDSDHDYPFYDCRSSMRDSSASVNHDYAYAYGYDCETRGTNDFHTKASTSSASRSIKDIDDNRDFMGIVESIPIRGNSNGHNIRISGDPYASSRYSDDGRSISSSSNAFFNGFLYVNPLAREIGISRSKGGSSNAYSNGILSGNPATRGIGVGRSRSGSSNANFNRVFGDNHASRGRFRRLLPIIRNSEPLARSNSGDYHDRANAEGYASGNSRGVIPSGDSSLMSPSRHRKSNIPSKDSKRRRRGLRVRFSDEVNNGDDHDNRGSDLDRDYDRIRSGRHNSHLNSDNSNRVRTSGSVDRESRNTDNSQIGSHGDYGNNSNYGSTRGNIDNYSNIAEIQSRFDGYGNCEICNRSEVREFDVMHSRSSIVDIDEGHVINNIYNDGGIVVNSGNDARSVIRSNKREHDNIAVNSSSGIDYTDECAYNGEYDWINQVGECDLESGYDYGDNDNESNGSSEEGAIGGERIPRLLPSRPSTNEMEIPVQMALQRKKSLPDVQVPLNAPASITREEVSVLSSARREEMRRIEEENERLRANPLLYLVSPHMKDWFTRQQLVLVILIVNITLALMFFKLLTS